MPTGYTADVSDGKITEFRDFALSCARAFGACVTLRDDAAGPAPTEIPPQTSYNETALKSARERRTWLLALTPEQTAEEARKAYAEALDSHNRYVASKAESRARYEAMLAKVRAWQPPTKDHIGMKEFMVQQLVESIDFDCTPYGEAPAELSASAWFARELERSGRDVEYHSRQIAEEVKRSNDRTAWLRALHGSLTPA